MTFCTGHGDDGDHCCYIRGKVCEFLIPSGNGAVDQWPSALDHTTQGETPCVEPVRCGKWETMGDDEWQAAPIGRVFARLYDGYTCHDWPQNIPKVMNGRGSKCCWGSD